MDYSLQNSKTLIINDNKTIRQIFIHQIEYIVCDTYLSSLFLIDGNKICCCKALKYFEEEIGDFGFLRINHSTILNARYFRFIKKGTKRIIVMEDGTEFAVSRRKWPIVKEKINVL